jgi:hypothetical protein
MTAVPDVILSQGGQTTPSLPSGRFRKSDLKALIKLAFPGAKNIRAGSAGMYFEKADGSRVKLTHQLHFTTRMWITALLVIGICCVLGYGVGVKSGSPSIVISLTVLMIMIAGVGRLLGERIFAHYETNVRNYLREAKASKTRKDEMLEASLRALWGLRYATPWLATRKTLNPFVWTAESVHIQDMVGDPTLAGFRIALEMEDPRSKNFNYQALYDGALQNALEILENQFKAGWSRSVAVPWIIHGLALGFGPIFLIIYLIYIGQLEVVMKWLGGS